MSKIKITYHQYLKMLLILHLGMMLGQLILIAIIFVLVNEESSVIDISTQNILLIAVPVGVISIVLIGKYFYQQSLKKIRQKTELNEKLKSYQTIQIIQFAFTEMGSLTCFLASFLTQNLVFVYGSIGVLLYFLSIRPAKHKLEKELDLTFNEQNKLSNPDYLVAEKEVSESD